MMAVMAAVWNEPPKPADEASYITDEHGQRMPWPPGPLATCIATVTTTPPGGASVSTAGSSSVTSAASSSSTTGTVATSVGGVTAPYACEPGLVE